MSHIFKNGNLKIGKDTLIFNISSATRCKSKELGMCQLSDPEKCYALKAEKMYPNVLPARDRQTEYWDTTLLKGIIDDINNRVFTIKIYGKRKIKYFRWNESGDFRTQEDIDKTVMIAERIPGIIFYCYTARKDLDFSDRPKNFIVNGSGFMLDNNYTIAPHKRATNSPKVKCKNDCSKCKYCKVVKGRIILQEMH